MIGLKHQSQMATIVGVLVRYVLDKLLRDRRDGGRGGGHNDVSWRLLRIRVTVFLAHRESGRQRSQGEEGGGGRVVHLHAIVLSGYVPPAFSRGESGGALHSSQSPPPYQSRPRRWYSGNLSALCRVENCAIRRVFFTKRHQQIHQILEVEL